MPHDGHDFNGHSIDEDQSETIPSGIDVTHALRILEAVLYVSETPVSLLMLRQAFAGEYEEQQQKLSNAQIEP